jgi:pyroglutamyl-peptidase
MTRILVTAFGPFDGRPENASGLALAGLKRSHPWIRTRVFPVDSVVAPSRLRRAVRDVRPELLVLLGEAAGSQAIRLETRAWNQIDFRIPDNAGRQPQDRPIHPAGPASLPCELPVQALLDRLAAGGWPVELSTDPGRYLCNQIYYVARSMMDPVVFIHLPLSSQLPTDDAAAALGAVIDFLAASKSQ